MAVTWQRVYMSQYTELVAVAHKLYVIMNQWTDVDNPNMDRNATFKSGHVCIVS
jgi:hypothetical protein